MRLAAAIAVCLAAAGPACAADNAQVNTIREMFARLESCWRAPPVAPNEPGMQLTVVFSFKRNGELMGPPRITFVSNYATAEQKTVFSTAVTEALQRCTPMPLTDGLGHAIAG
jgi:hypothetical protein